MTRGSIHWVILDKKRPAVVVSVDRRNQLANDVIVVPCSSRARPMSWHVPLRKGQGGLLTDSTAKCEQIATVPKSMVVPTSLGPVLDARTMAAIERGILLAVGILPPVP